MSRRLRRLPLLLLPIALATTLVACGSDSSDGGSSDSSSSSAADALQGITVTGDLGKEPQVKWNGELKVDKAATTVVHEGDGQVIADGDQVQAYLWIGNGTTQKKAYSDFDSGQPETVTASADMSPILKDAVLGQKVGSRVAVTTTSAEAFGESGNPQLGIGNEDTVLILVDLMGVTQVLDGPDGKSVPAPSWAPGLITDGDTITGLDFSDTPKPDGKLRSAALIEGSGATVKKGQTITVNYLGQVYDAPAPFDESYTKSPASFAIGVNQVVPGWDKTLVGATVGSRMILAIPPADGYGKDGNAQAGIKGTDTLYFVVDILGAS